MVYGAVLFSKSICLKNPHAYLRSHADGFLLVPKDPRARSVEFILTSQFQCISESTQINIPKFFRPHPLA